MIIAIVLVVTGINSGAAQKPHDYPEIGKPCPEFIMHEIHQYKVTKASLSDFRNKPLIIDFFEQYCVACFESFPKLKTLQEEFKDKVQFLLFGYDKKFGDNSTTDIREDYRKYQEHFKLNIPVAFDSATVDRFRIMSFPYVVWIDGGGIVRAITRSDELTQENIRTFIDGQPVDLPMTENVEQGNNDHFYNPDQLLLSNGNGGNDSDFLCRSVLMDWKYRQDFYHDLNVNARNIKNLQGVGFPLFGLYKQAFGDTVTYDVPPEGNVTDNEPNHYGQWYLQPVLENCDSSQFQPNYSTGKNVYSYSLVMKNARWLKDIQKRMQNDLGSYFKLNVRVENRSLPCLKLIATDNARQKLPTKGGKANADYSQSGFAFTNQPVSKIIFQIWGYNPTEVVIDETGIMGNIDIQIDAILTDFEDFRKALKKQGLDIIRDKRVMKAIVFNCPENG